MIMVTIEKSYGAATVRARVTAPTIERAVAFAGPGSRVEFPIAGEEFFAPEGRPAQTEGIDYGAMTLEGIEQAYEAGLPGAHGAYLDALADDLGEDAAEAYAVENCLV